MVAVIEVYFLGFACVAMLLCACALAWWLWQGRNRRCSECRFPLTLLGHKDEHLQESEKLEVSLGSVGFEVWACQSCGHVIKLRRRNWSTEYSKCPKCHARTNSAAEKTIEPATDYSFGKVLITENCVNCGYRREQIHVTPMIDDESWHQSRRGGDR